jgi:hypothetical protein
MVFICIIHIDTMILIGDNPEFQAREIIVPPENKRTISQQQVVDSGLPELIAAVSEEVRKRYIASVSDSMTYEPYISEFIYKDLVLKTLENYISLIKMADCQEMVEEKVVENLSRYAVGPIIEHRYFGVSTEIPLNLFSANVTGGCLTVTFDTGFSHISRRYTDLTTSHVMGVLLVDAARDLLMGQRDSIALEVESIQKAQKIYQEYAALAAASLVSKYQGKTRVSQKGNRITVNFYLSDSEKAFITFFRDNMPWNIPDPPENPESLRMICSQKNSPFIIVSLSKQDRRYLKK